MWAKPEGQYGSWEDPITGPCYIYSSLFLIHGFGPPSAARFKTSGSICLYEVNCKVLFTGDTVFAEGTLSYISESGSVGDYINSIGRLGTMKVNEVCPGHGTISRNPEEHMKKALLNARSLLRNGEEVEIVHELPPASSSPLRER